MRAWLLVFCVMAGLAAGAVDFTRPGEWRLVNTNAVNAWNAGQRKRASATYKVWPGVAADTQKREVRVLAEAVGHREGVTVELLLVGPLSDRVYESAAVTVAWPGDIVRAVESLGLARGGGVGSKPFRLWPVGERVEVKVLRLGAEGAAEQPLAALVKDSGSAPPLIGEGGLVFTGGVWEGPAANGVCLADTNMPSSVISLYNEPSTLFDLPFQIGQGAAYGRLTLDEELPFGALLEIVLRPLPAKDGLPRVLPLAVTAAMAGPDVELTCAGAGGAVLKRAGAAEVLVWLRGQVAAGREPFVTLGMDEKMPVKRAVDVARLFAMLDGQGLKLDGKPEQGLFSRAFLPQEGWRERKDRNPQPFELHVAQGADGVVKKRLVFIEEDWNVQGLDPKLTPRDYPFETWEELPKLVEKAGGARSKVPLLFVFAPAEQPLSLFMPGVRALAERLPLVYVFGE